MYWISIYFSWFLKGSVVINTHSASEGINEFLHDAWDKKADVRTSLNSLSHIDLGVVGRAGALLF